MNGDAECRDLLADRADLGERNDNVPEPGGIGAGDQLVQHHLGAADIEAGDEMEDRDHSGERSAARGRRARATQYGSSSEKLTSNPYPPSQSRICRRE